MSLPTMNIVCQVLHLIIIHQFVLVIHGMLLNAIFVVTLSDVKMRHRIWVLLVVLLDLLDQAISHGQETLKLLM